MSRDLPTPEQIIEELADKAASHIDRMAPVAFDAAFDELTRYHRFLLGVNASRSPDGKPFNYASIPGQHWEAPHNDWIRQYRELLERAANRIADAPEFFHKLAHTPLRLLPHSGDPQLPDDVLGAILDFYPILMHRLEAWVTKRTVAEVAPGEAATPRLRLAGSDAKAYANLLPNIVGAWESLLQLTPSLFGWRDGPNLPEDKRWDTLAASWPYLSRHLANTAYMLAVAVWNEDETGAALLRDALVRWPRTLSHEFHDCDLVLQRPLLFPTITEMGLAAARKHVRPLLPEHMPDPSPDELFTALLQSAHDDVLVLTSALVLLWSIDAKQSSDIGARIAAELLRGVLEDDGELRGTRRDKTFASLVMEIVRLEVIGDRHAEKGYAADLDRMVERLDNMTERRVVPGRIFTPSTLHGRDELQPALLAMLLSRTGESNDALLRRINDIASDEAALPAGDRSLRYLVQGIERLAKALDPPAPSLQRGLELLDATADLATAADRTKSIMTTMVENIEAQRTARLRAKPVSEEAIAELRDSVEKRLLSPPGGVVFFRGFSIAKTSQLAGAELFTSTFPGLSKAQFVDPPMEWETTGFTEHYARLVSQQAGRRVWRLFADQPRELVSVAAPIEDPAFWHEVLVFASGVGAEPMLLVSQLAEGRALRRFVHRVDAAPGGLMVTRRSEMGDHYIATIEGVDVFAGDFPAGKAWLFSPYILQSLQYATISADDHVVAVQLRLEEDLKGTLVAEYRQAPVWQSWPIYDISCEDPDDA